MAAVPEQYGLFHLPEPLRAMKKQVFGIRFARNRKDLDGLTTTALGPSQGGLTTGIHAEEGYPPARRNNGNSFRF
ncbi:hypothetical protein FHT76_007956 [Rhizobium sp. BK176]|nr:hypothetical protein [Rhizobium sp. BK176]